MAESKHHTGPSLVEDIVEHDDTVRMHSADFARLRSFKVQWNVWHASTENIMAGRLPV